MKNYFLLLITVAMADLLVAQNTGIGTNSPNSSAKLDIASANGGLLVPRMTTSQRNSIANPAKGLLVFDSATRYFWFYDGSSWSRLQSQNSVRFGFDLTQTSTASSSYNLTFLNNYNLAPATVTLVNATTLQIQQQGLYHFSLLGYKHKESAASVAGPSSTLNLSVTINGEQYKIITNGIQTSSQSSDWQYESTALAFDLFVPSNSQITINVAVTSAGNLVRTDNAHFFGYLISEQ
jgi:hypothetical protein